MRKTDYTTVYIIIVLLLGIFLGILYLNRIYNISVYLDSVLDVGLCLLMLFVGISIGVNRKILKDLKNLGFKFLFIPIFALIGSILGGLIFAAIVKMPLAHGGAIASGMGWYSFSAILIAPYSTSLSFLAFTTNILREILAIILIPFISKKIGYLETIGASGATAMDTALPMIAKSTNEQTVLLAFISGIIMTILVPVFVNLFMI